MKILNLFAGIGGNRTFWDQLPNLEITAVESEQQIADIYQKRFPHDVVVVADAYEYCQEHLDEFDVIWASPPCQTHTRMIPMFFKNTNHPPPFPDYRLYGLNTYLSRYFKGIWVIENVIPYYEPLIKPTIILERHCFWSNKPILNKQFKGYPNFKDLPWEQLCEYLSIPTELVKDYPNMNESNHCGRQQILRNCVIPELGLYVLQSILGKTNQKTMWEMLP